MAYLNGQKIIMGANVASANLPIDQTYSPESKNAQSGKAVAQALNKNNLKLLKTITLEEEVADITVTFDKGLKEIALFMNVGFDAEATSKILCARSDSGIWYMFSEGINLKIEKQFFYAHAKEIKERHWVTICHDTSITSLQGLNTSATTAKLVSSERKKIVPQYVKDLNFFILNREQKFAAGTTVEIWGVEA